MLDGTKDSLVAALNTLEIYGTPSGLRGNMDKTKLVWLEKKKHSKDKCNIGIQITRNYVLCCSLLFFTEFQTFEPLYDKIKCILSTWKKCHLTPLGKITVLKTFIRQASITYSQSPRTHKHLILFSLG